MAIECPKCQTNNPDTQKFCGDCGTPLSIEEPIEIQHPTLTQPHETPKEELSTGSIFATRYQIIEEVGKGGMGRVYKALDTEIDEKVALKLIKPEIASDKKVIERFRNELKTARKIGHKNVCRMYDLNKDKNSYYITMEFVSGGDLKSLIRRTRQLAVGTTLSIGKQICEGLTEAHILGIVHRDLKPNNIMIDDNGNVRIMDFGIARTVKEKGITGSGIMIGTPEYMSPEQVEGKEVDLRSDIYSLGIVLYEMLTGRLPFEGDTPFSIGVKQKGERPKDPRKYNPNISENLSRLILTCLEKDRVKRYLSAAEVFSALERAEQGLPTAERVEPEKKQITSKEITVSFSVKKLLFPALLILILVAAALIFFISSGDKLDPDRFVVAVFENRTGDETLDNLGSIAADVITQGLSQMSNVEAVPSMTALQISEYLEGKTRNMYSLEGIRAFGKETGARTVISGFFSMEVDKIRFRARFTDAKKGKVLIALDPVDGQTKEEALETLRQRVMGALSSFRDKSIFEGNPLRHIPTYEAYQEYIMGYEQFGKDYAKALTHYERALELDPDFVLPRLSIGVAYGNMEQYEKSAFHLNLINDNREKLTPWERDYLDWTLANLEGNQAQEMHFLRRLEKQTPGDFIVNYIIGGVSIGQNRPGMTVETFRKLKFPEYMINVPAGSWRFTVLASAYHMLSKFTHELKTARRAQELFPGFLSLKAREVRALAAMGKIEEMEKVIEESRTITSRYGTLAYVMYEASVELRVRGFLKESKVYANQAVEEYRNILSRNGSEDVQSALARALIYADQLEESKTSFESLTQANPGNIEYKRCLGTLEAMMGHQDAALQIYRELENTKGPYIYGEHTYGMACISAWLGEKDLAVELLKKSFADGYAYGVYLHQSIFLDPLRDYPPYKVLIRPKK